MESSLIQLLTRNEIDEKYIGNDNTLFINDFNLPKKSYKHFDSEKKSNIQIDDSLNINLNYKHHYLTENYIKIKIPFFKCLEIQLHYLHLIVII